MKLLSMAQISYRGLQIVPELSVWLELLAALPLLPQRWDCSPAFI